MILPRGILCCRILDLIYTKIDGKVDATQPLRQKSETVLSTVGNFKDQKQFSKLKLEDV